MILSKAVVSFQYRQRLLSLFILTLRNFSIIMKKLFIYSLLATVLMSPQGIKAKATEPSIRTKQDGDTDLWHFLLTEPEPMAK